MAQRGKTGGNELEAPSALHVRLAKFAVDDYSQKHPGKPKLKFENVTFAPEEPHVYEKLFPNTKFYFLIVEVIPADHPTRTYKYVALVSDHPSGKNVGLAFEDGENLVVTTSPPAEGNEK